MRYFSFIILILSFLVIISCKGSKKKNLVSEDNFYTNKSFMDAVRIPLLKPYELIKLNSSSEWVLSLVSIPGSISNVKEVAVNDGQILLHSGETYCNNELVAEAWFIIDVNKKTERGFDNIQLFSDFLRDNKIRQIKLTEVEKTYSYFLGVKKLDWDLMNAK